MVFQAEFPRVLADDLHVAPPESLETLARHFAERRGEVNEVNSFEELGYVDEF